MAVLKFVVLLLLKVRIKVMKNLEKEIKELKNGRTMKQIKLENRKLYYKIQSKSQKLSVLRAESKGNFLTKEHLSEFKGLIIWILKNKTNYRGYLNLVEAMKMMLDKVENENIVYISNKGIKSVIVRLAIGCGLTVTENNLRAANGISDLTNSYGNTLLEDFWQFRINALMGN